MNDLKESGNYGKDLLNIATKLTTVGLRILALAHVLAAAAAVQYIKQGTHNKFEASRTRAAFFKSYIKTDTCVCYQDNL